MVRRYILNILQQNVQSKYNTTILIDGAKILVAKNTASIIDGKAIAASVHAKTKSEIDKLIASGLSTPTLAIVLVGNDPASEIYVRNKIKAAEKISINTRLVRFDNDISHQQLIKEVQDLNADKNVSGVILQLPLPKQINKDKIINAIDPMKDVDGFHPINVGKLYSGIGEGFAACTALGCLELIRSTGHSLSGANVVIIGRSNIVGRPLAALLLQNDCTVTIAHSRTNDLPSLTKKADIVVSAVGKPKFLTKGYFNKDAIVIDVGITRVEYNDRCEIAGDVDFDNVVNHVGYISPVPGGVGPMTVAYLLSNCVKAYRLQFANK